MKTVTRPTPLNTRLAFSLLLAITLGFATSSGNAQVFPNFPTGTANPSEVLDFGASVIDYGSGLYPNQLLATFPVETVLSYGYSTDGSHFSSVGRIIDHNSGIDYQVNCSNKATCSSASAIFKGTAYIAFAEQNTKGLYVLSVGTFPGNQGYKFTLAYTFTGQRVTSAPAMAVAPDGVHLIIRYGTNNTINGLNNATYTTEFDGANWSSYVSGAFAPTQSAIVAFNNHFYAIDKEDYSGTTVYVSQIDNNGINISGSSYAVPNWKTQYGIAAIVFENNIVAIVQSTQSNHDFFIFSSPDGKNWYPRDYTNSRIGSTPSVTNFNGGLVSVFEANDSSRWLYSSYAPN